MTQDKQDSIFRARLSLDGLSIGDAFGEMFSYRPLALRSQFEDGTLPSGPWRHTDDTEMAIVIFEMLARFGRIDADLLAMKFADRFRKDSERGYGKGTRILLDAILTGGDWRQLSTSAFGGQGSMGNGAAMRVAPLGAFFADDLNLVIQEASLSATPTHAHPEAQAGAIAVAVAAATAWQSRVFDFLKEVEMGFLNFKR